MNRNTEEFVNQNASPPLLSHFHEPDHIVVLLALRDGQEFLSAQLESIAAQTHREWSLIISDDGSKDSWLDTVTEFARKRAPNRVWLTSGPRKGFAANFLSLVMMAGPTAPFAAFCDQDDVWLPGKLTRAMDVLRKAPAGTPAIYCGRTTICDAELRPNAPSIRFGRKPGFQNALVQNIGGGNTMVVNRAALDLLQDTYAHAKGVVAHDWWAYQLISGAGGTIYYDPEPYVLYRQHGNNAIGANTSLRASLTRFCQGFQGRYRTWNAANLAALENVAHWLTDEAQRTLTNFQAARTASFGQRLLALKQSGVYRQTLRGSFALWLAAAFRKL